MTNKLTKKEKEYADELLRTGSKRKAVKKAYELGSKGGSKTEEDKNITADAIAAETSRKPQVQAYLEDNADGASSRIVEISKTAENESVKLNANKDILDRAGYKAVEKKDLNIGGSLNLIDLLNKADEK